MVLCALYENYGKNRPEGGLVDEDGHFYTNLLFTTLSPVNGKLYGMATGKMKHGKLSSKFEYGNIFSLFAEGVNNDHTLVHEAAHTFSLDHTFSLAIDNNYVFYYGYTENYMDYHFYHTFNNLVEKNLFILIIKVIHSYTKKIIVIKVKCILFINGNKI